jgi:hypothetical protein
MIGARTGLVLILIVAALGAASRSDRSMPFHVDPHTTVLAELFTSEGCSSCPPADALLRRLVAEQPVAGVDIVALGSHVDYWDRLGWRDAFSSPIFSQRQSLYGTRVFGSDRIYTPQIVIDGHLESIGSDEASVRRAIVTAAEAPHATVDVVPERSADGTVRVDVRVRVPEPLQRRDSAEILVAVTEDDLVTRVQRGENGGRTLTHGAVVRLLKSVSHIRASDRVASAFTVVKLDKSWDSAHLRLVGFLQETGTRRVLGSGTALLTAAAVTHMATATALRSTLTIEARLEGTER